MCGIVGAVVRPGALTAPDLERAVGSLRHRGPDGRGVLLAGRTAHWEVWLGHARLAIVDLSPAGAQPMERPGGAITFNGELYNHRSLRQEMEPLTPIRSRSDTEVLLAGLLLHGPEFLERTNAMLALGLWDVRRTEIVLARDRLGKKPLYYYRDEQRLLFASEIKALVELGAPLLVDETSLSLFRWLGYVPDNRSIWQGISKLPAASFARLSLASERLPSVIPRLYWDPLAACGRVFHGSLDDGVDRVLELLDDATRIRLDADVPVGVFLSGGIDSSLVAASVARAAPRSTTAFTIGSADPKLDESSVAEDTARRLGLGFERLSLELDAYDEQVSKIAWYYDEPLGDVSQIPTMANAQAARRRVTVVLTGDGGDEVFLGYPWLGYPERLWRMRRSVAWFPGGPSIASKLLSTRAGSAALRVSVRALGLNVGTLENKKAILQATLRSERPDDLYERFHSARQREALEPVDRTRLPPSLLRYARTTFPAYAWDAAQARSLPELLGALDLVTYLRSDVLVKVDRATMAYSLEARAPLLDYRIVELGMSLPLAFKMHRGTFKRVLRRAAERRVGATVAARPKQGFGIPEPPRGDAAPGAPSERWAAATERRFFAAWPRRGAEGDDRAPARASVSR